MDWQALSIGLGLLLITSVLGIVIAIARDVHDATLFRQRHENDITKVAQQVRDIHDSWGMSGVPHQRMMDMAAKTEDLYRWHDVRDEDGVPSWYVRKSLEDKIEGLAAAIMELSKSIKNGS